MGFFVEGIIVDISASDSNSDSSVDFDVLDFDSESSADFLDFLD